MEKSAGRGFKSHPRLHPSRVRTGHIGDRTYRLHKVTTSGRTGCRVVPAHGSPHSVCWPSRLAHALCNLPKREIGVISPTDPRSARFYCHFEQRASTEILKQVRSETYSQAEI